MDKLILFGAGVYAKKYKALLEYLDMDFDYFTDNDEAKWDTKLYDKNVISVDELLHIQNCRIIISSTHEAAIRNQLLQMGLGENIIGLDELYNMCAKKMQFTENGSVMTNGRETIIVDMYEGIGWGGSELWAADLAYRLKDVGYDVILMGSTEQPELENKYESITVRISVEETISKMVRLIESSMPCTFINNFAGCAFMAAVIVKRKYPNILRIISVVHSDSKSLFDAHMMLSDYIDRIFCVGNRICIHMQELYDFDHNSYYTKEQPIETDILWNRVANMYGTLRIGYAARIVKQAKRTDLLVDLIELLEKKGIDYIFQIAGEGECSELIEKYIVENNLGSKVCLMGRLPKSHMDSFWKNQDVYVSVSEYEGTSLSMLEAMGYGCVPVVTDVSGAGEFIEQGENGFICDVGDIEGIADCIAELAGNRELLESYGETCRRTIQKRCNPEEYIKYWEENILGEWL